MTGHQPPNWAAARRNQTRRRLIGRTRFDDLEERYGRDYAETVEHHRAEQARLRRIAEQFAVHNHFAASVVRQVGAGRPVTPAQARTLNALEQASRPQRDDTTSRANAQTVHCSNCHAQPGEPCLRRNGQPRSSCHLERHHTYLSVSS